MENATKHLVDRFWKAFESNNLDELDSFIDPDLHFKMPGIDLNGLTALKPMLAAYITAFPDMKHEVKHWVASGDVIVLELEVTATHTGPMATPNGMVPATGRKLTLSSCDYIRVKNGKVVSWHGYFDNMVMMAALGLVPSS